MVYMFYKKLCVSIARGHDSGGGAGGVGVDSRPQGKLSPSEKSQIWQDILLP